MVDPLSANGGGGGGLYSDDPDVETVTMNEEDRSRHPDLRDLSA